MTSAPLRIAFTWIWTLSLMASAAARAESVGLLTFIEVKVEARGHAANVLRERARALAEHTSTPGRIILLQEVSRPERFALLALDQPAVPIGGAQEIDLLPRDLADELTAPPDRRPNREFEPDSGSTRTKIDTRANIYVIAHLDLALSSQTSANQPGADRARVETALHQLAATARQSDGNLGFDIWQQTERPNHFNLISGWISESQFHAFEATRAAREFREIVGPLLGSPYDERLFRRVD